MKLDNIDIQLLNCLQKDARISAVELAEIVSLSTTPCRRRQRLLEKAGVIRGYVALIDQNLIGLPVNALVSIRLEKRTEKLLSAFEAQIKQCPEVMFCYKMTGEFDYLMHVVSADLPDYERFMAQKLTTFPGVSDIQTSLALRQIVNRSAFSLDYVDIG